MENIKLMKIDSKSVDIRDPELRSNQGTICILVEMIPEDGKKRHV